MFATRPPYEVTVPDQLRDPGETFWRALAMTTNAPWYIATFASLYRKRTHLRSMCFCWELDLVAAIEGAGPRALRSLQMICPPLGQRPGWALREIARIWRLRESADPHQSPFLLEDAAGACLCSLTGSEVDPDFNQREVVAEVLSNCNS